MREQEVRELYEAYMQVHQVQEVVEEVEELDEEPKGLPYGPVGKGFKKLPAGPKRNKMMKREKDYTKKAMDYASREGEAAGEDRQKMGRISSALTNPRLREETDLFDTILEYLIAEGYAETPEAATAIMANMSEEWRQDIMEISQKTATKAYATSSTGEFEGADSPRDVERTNRLRKHIVRKFGAEAGEHADAAADARTFGRRDASGRRKQRPEPRIQTSDHRTTKDGKMHKQDQRELKTNLRIRRDRRLRAAEDN